MSSTIRSRVVRARRPLATSSRNWSRTFSRLIAVPLVALLATGTLGLVQSSGASAAPKTALLNADTVNAGTNSPEYKDLVAAGFSVNLVSGSTWDSYTAAQFASYSLLVAGDPTCGPLAASVTSDESVWAPVVMGTSVHSQAGNRILIGTDPVYHGVYGGVPNALKLVSTGLAYAGSTPAGTTGLYLDDSCDSLYGGNIATDGVLNRLTSQPAGGWSEDNSPPCGGNVSLITSNPSFAGLSSGDLAGWECSVHESFPQFPSDWSPLAIATDTASHPVCGTDTTTGATACGEPYILVSGAGLVVTAPNLSLAPTTGSDTVGGSHTVMATVTQAGSPLNGQLVNFTITGQNAGVTGTCAPSSCVTDSNGQVSFTYSDANGAGTDTVAATFTDSSGSKQQATASEVWAGPAITSLTWASPPAITYGTALSSAQLAAVVAPSGATGTTSYNLGTAGGSPLASGSILPAGKYALWATFTPSSSAYASATATVSMTVNPAVLTISASSESSVYGSAPGAITPSYSGLVNGDTAPATLPTCSTTASASSPVGSYPSTCSGAGDPNYTVSYVDGTDFVTPATLTVAASSENSVYGSAPGAITPSYSGLVNGDTAPATLPTCATTASASSPVGSYPSTCSGAGDPNYTVSYVAGSATVTKATLTVTANSDARVYHLANPILTATVTGFVNGDGATSVSGTASCATSAVIDSPVGTYPVTCTTGTLAAQNYTFSFAPGVLSVTPMPTVLVITSSDTLANGAVTVTASLTEQLTGAAVPGETVTFTAGSLSATGTSNPASATLALSNNQYVLGALFAGDANYLGSNATQTLYVYQPSSFVVWGGNAGGVTLGSDQNFWGARWSAQVTGGSYSAGSSFKGYASSVDSGNSTWTASPGNSGRPPTTVDQYIGVIVTTNAAKSGSVISGNIAEVVVLKVDNPSTYANDPGHPGNGVVQATVS